jgi:hypothetical protein
MIITKVDSLCDKVAEGVQVQDTVKMASELFGIHSSGHELRR